MTEINSEKLKNISVHFAVVAVLYFFSSLISCGGENNKNKQPLDQYNIDRSNNYKYIFSDQMKRDEEKEKKKAKDEKGPFEE